MPFSHICRATPSSHLSLMYGDRVCGGGCVHASLCRHCASFPPPTLHEEESEEKTPRITSGRTRNRGPPTEGVGTAGNPALYMPLNPRDPISPLTHPMMLRGERECVYAVVRWCAEGVCVCADRVLCTCVCVPVCARDLVQTLGFLPAAADPGAPATFTSRRCNFFFPVRYGDLTKSQKKARGWCSLNKIMR